MKPQMKLLGEQIEINEACEPTDIIWENRHYYESTRNIKRAFVYIAIVIMLTLSGSVIFTFTNISNNLKNKYPIVDCSTFKKEFGVDEETEIES